MTREVPLYTATGEFLGYYDEDDRLRPLISRGEARVVRKGSDRRVVLTKSSGSSFRVRALSSVGATRALSTTYEENLYPDSPEMLARAKDEGRETVVTCSLFTLKKHRPGVGLVPWSDTDGFRRSRFNPDKQRPLYKSESEMLARTSST